MQKQTEVLVVCPDCERVYVQRVTGEYIGPRRRAPNYDPALQQRCKEHGQSFDRGEWYGLMVCAECSIRQAPPSLRETARKWLQEGERSLWATSESSGVALSL